MKDKIIFGEYNGKDAEMFLEAQRLSHLSFPKMLKEAVKNYLIKLKGRRK